MKANRCAVCGRYLDASQSRYAGFPEHKDEHTYTHSGKCYARIKKYMCSRSNYSRFKVLKS